MKKKRVNFIPAVFAVLLCFGVVCFASAESVYANMAAPLEDRGSGILFDKHETVRVDSEVLNITFHKSAAPKSATYRRATAHISAVYTMTNTSGEAVTVNAMFLSPLYGKSLSENEFTVTADGLGLEYTVEFFSSHLRADDLLNWEQILADADKEEDGSSSYVSAVSYTIDFLPGQTVELAVSYDYLVNVNTYNESNRMRLYYYLTPAKYWKDFGKLTINLTLDDEHPYLVYSSLDFKRQSKGVYKFESNGLPQSELVITAGNFMGYIGFGTEDSEILLYLAIIFFAVATALFILLIAPIILRRKRKDAAPRKKRTFLRVNHIAAIAFIYLLCILTFIMALSGFPLWIYAILSIFMLGAGAIIFALIPVAFCITYFVGKHKSSVRG